MRLSAWLSAAFVLVVSTSASAQQIDPEFTKAREARIEALGTGDQAAFERYTADAFSATGPTGRVEDKAQRVARANKPVGQNGAAREDETITPYGDDTVVLTWRTSNPRGGGMRFLEVWVTERGTWKVAAVQLTLIPNPK